jgi:hypothetical protein
MNTNTSTKSKKRTTILSDDFETAYRADADRFIARWPGAKLIEAPTWTPTAGWLSTLPALSNLFLDATTKIEIANHGYECFSLKIEKPVLRGSDGWCWTFNNPACCVGHIVAQPWEVAVYLIVGLPDGIASDLAERILAIGRIVGSDGIAGEGDWFGINDDERRRRVAAQGVAFGAVRKLAA